MAYKKITFPQRIRGNFLDAPIERGQINLEYYKAFEQVTLNFNDLFSERGNLKLKGYTTSERPSTPDNYELIYEADEGAVFVYNGADWVNVASVVDGGSP